MIHEVILSAEICVVVVQEIRVYILSVTRRVKYGSMTSQAWVHNKAFGIKASLSPRVFPIRANHCCSATKSCLSLHDPMDYSMPGSLSSSISWRLLRFKCLKSEMLSNHLISAALFYSCLYISQHQFFPISLLFASDGQRLDLQLQHPSFQ